MSTPGHRLRAADAADVEQLLGLWALLSDEVEGDADTSWKAHARQWFTRVVEDTTAAWFPVIDLHGLIVATAIGTLELGVPNPWCRRGRAVRLANVVTLPEHRRKGHGTVLIQDVVAWARSIDADRVDLSATGVGQRLYETAGFTLTTAPRMKLVL